MSIPLTDIGKYQVVDRLAKGGMGTLYLARDLALDRLVAIKVLHGDFENEELRERFSREARSISRVRHPNIVTIFEYGDFKGQPFIAMEYISGESLAEVIRRRAPLSIARKLQMMEEVCAGMAYAHRAQIIHRDLKPANIMIDAEGGLIRILDFGIARTVESDVTRLTQVVGTPSYMSPEQALAKRVDHRTDIFSIGAVFYELLSYHRAFDGENPVTILERIQREEPSPLAQVCPDVHSLISSVVEKALHKDPDRRYQDLDAMRAEISYARHWITQSAEPATPATPSRGSAPTPIGARPASRLEQRRLNQIRQYLESAQSAIETHDYEAAIESCEQVLLFDEMNAQALAIIGSAHAALEEAAVQARVRQARDFLDARALTEAEAALTEALKLRALDPAALALQRDLYRIRHERERARERGAAAELAMARARVCLAEGAYESAARAASEALANSPDSTEAGELKELALRGIEKRAQEEELRRGVAEALDLAHRRFEAGEHAVAIGELERFTPVVPEITSTLERLRQRREAIDRQRRIEEEERNREEQRRRLEEEQQERSRQVAACVVNAGRLIEEGDFDGALQALNELERIDATNSDLLQLRDRALSRQAAARAAALRRRQIEMRIASGTQHFVEDRLDQAQLDAEAALDLDPANVDAQRLRARIQAGFDERRRLKVIEQRARKAVDEALVMFERGDLDRAVSSLEQCDPQHPVVEAGLQELRARCETFRRHVSHAVAAAEHHFEKGDHKAALVELERLTPVTSDVTEALVRLRQRITAVEFERAEAERRRRERDEERLRRERAEQQQRERSAIRQKVATLATAAGRLIDESDFDGALQALTEAEDLDAANMDVVRLRSLVTSRREERRRETEQAARVAAERRWLSDQLHEARAAFEQRQYTVALRVLDTIQDRSPDADGVAQLRDATLGAQSRQEEAARRQEEVEQSLGRARRYASDQAWLPALHSVERALALDPGHSPAVSLRDTIVQALDEERRLTEAAERERRRRSELRASTTAAVEKALAADDIAQAETALEACERELGSDGTLASLRVRIDTARRSLEARQTASNDDFITPTIGNDALTALDRLGTGQLTDREEIIVPHVPTARNRGANLSYLAVGGLAIVLTIAAVALRRNRSPEDHALPSLKLTVKAFGPVMMTLPAGTASNSLIHAGAPAPDDNRGPIPTLGGASTQGNPPPAPVQHIELPPAPPPPAPPPSAPPPSTPAAPSVDERLEDLFRQFQGHQNRGELDDALKTAEDAFALRRDDPRFLTPLDGMFNDLWRSAADAQAAGAREKLNQFAPGAFTRATDALARARVLYSEGQRVAAIRSVRLADGLFREATAEGKRNRADAQARDTRSIQELMQQYRTAYEQKDAATFGRLSGMSERAAGELKNAWKTRSKMTLTLDVGPIVFTDDGQGASAVCQRTEQYSDVGAPQAAHKMRITFRFAKVGSAWSVQSSSADAIR